MEKKASISAYTAGENLFESFIIKNLNSFEELMDIYQTYKNNNPQKTIIVTLDDLGQAEYTSTHAMNSNDLEDTEGHDLSGLDAACFENGEHLGYLSTPEEFFIIKKNFLKQTEGVDFAEACDKGLTVDDQEMEILKKINQSPLEFLDKEIVLKIIPVTRSYEGICGFPNGYFHSDLDPFENYALAKHLFEKYGYELFGIGASFLGFIRSENLEPIAVQDLSADIAKLYDAAENTFDPLVALVQNKNHLFLKYTESLVG